MRNRYLTPARGAPEYRSVLDARPGIPELRYAPLEVRDVDGLTLAGRAIVFDSPSVDMGYWTEIIKRGATRKVLATKPDTRLLVNHDGLPYARTTSGTLSLRESPEGLDWKATLPDTQAARDLIVSIERRDIDQMSFAFRVANGGAFWTENEDGSETRTVTEIAHLPEISIVTFPAYEATSVTASNRSAEGADPQEGTGDRESQPESQAADQRATDQSAAPDPAGATTEPIAPAIDAEWIAARRRRQATRARG